MIQIIGAPFDFGGNRLGSRLGPDAIRLADIEQALRELGFQTRDRGDIPIEGPGTADEGFRAFEGLLHCIEQLREWVSATLEAGDFPIVLGGEHTLTTGCVSSALNLAQRQLGLLWVDAHADIHTPASSPSGHLHGMPLAALQGLESGVAGVRDAQWKRLLRALGPARLSPAQISWFALRDVDAGERERVRKGSAITMHEIDRFGIDETVERLDRYWRHSGTKQLWISFDVDALDPILAPGTGTAVRGGLSYREAHLLAELIREHLDASDCPYKLIGIDVVETNPLADSHNETARMAVEWMASLLGKTILGRVSS